MEGERKRRVKIRGSTRVTNVGRLREYSLHLFSRD